MRFTWDPAKAKRNRALHGISFETALEVFSDPNQVATENYFLSDEGEQRYALIGATRGLVLLVVVFVERDNNGEETIRLISARKAEGYEKSIYEDQFR